MVTLFVYWISAKYKSDAEDIYWGTCIVDVVGMLLTYYTLVSVFGG